VRIWAVWRRAVLLILVFSLSGCFIAHLISPEKVDRPDADHPGFVYGYLNTADGSPDGVWLVKKAAAYGPWTKRYGAWMLGAGEFFFENIPPGTYILEEFDLNDEHYELGGVGGTSSSDFIFKIGDGFTYLGSWEVGKVSHTFLIGGGKFKLKTVSHPGPPAILKKIRKCEFIAGQGWDGRLAKEIKKLE